jgi:hypothetical protein
VDGQRGIQRITRRHDGAPCASASHASLGSIQPTRRYRTGRPRAGVRGIRQHQRRGVPFEAAKFMTKTCEREQKRYPAAIKAQAQVRRLQLPAIAQLNVASQQVNVPGIPELLAEQPPALLE